MLKKRKIPLTIFSQRYFAFGLLGCLLMGVVYAQSTQKKEELNQIHNQIQSEPLNNVPGKNIQGKNQSQRWFNEKNHRLNLPITGLSDEAMDAFVLGRSFFTVPWVAAPAVTTARDGLGPLFNANTCNSCHRGNGLGEKYNQLGHISRAMVSKISLPINKDKKASNTMNVGVKNYGRQIAVNGILGVPFEALPTLTQTPFFVHYPDGNKVLLQRPLVGLKKLQYGALPDDTVVVQRRSPSLIGLGLLEKVSDKTILKQADIDDKNHDGISGKPNWVIDYNGNKRLGRFTAKASVATVLEQTAIAAANDMGLTNPLFPNELCEPNQIACKNAPIGRKDPMGKQKDLTRQRLSAISRFITSTQVPVKKALNESQKKGQMLFKKINCSSCHLPNMKTVDGVAFSPYTDLLVHDMGEDLADNRQEFSAGSQEFRTAPLWGLSTYEKNLASGKAYYLHDGRAQSVEAAILWHGGEAEASKKAFMKLPKQQRQILLNFLNHL